MRNVGWTLSISILAALLAAGTLTFADADARSISYDLNIPSEDLTAALQSFAIASHHKLLYKSELTAGKISRALKGHFTAREAMEALLSGTGLSYEITGSSVVLIKDQRDGKTSNLREEGTRPESATPSQSSGEQSIRLAQSSGQSQTNPDGSQNLDVPASPSPSSESEKDKISEIVVTGTHIRGVSPASSVIEIGREEIDRSGYTSIADLMLSLPQNFGGGYNAGNMVGNSPVNINYGPNPTGASVPNLRGLGPGSTLTLVDGHRMASGLTAGGADIASIPLDAIDRIEVLTDSASAVYGSDAVAGVVNIILKRDYDGAKTSLSYGFAPDGGGAEKRASQLFGTHWDGGDVLVAYEHMQQDTVDARDRKFASTAMEPNSLLPQTRSNSVTLSATQELSAMAAVFGDGLYIARDANLFSSSPFYPAAVAAPSTLRKYAATAGLNFNLPHDWKATLFANAAQDVTTSDSMFLTAPITTPAGDERLVGTTRGAEANANGGIATLASGIVRLAVGVGYRKEGFSNAAGLTSASTAYADGSRNIRYAFGELSVPLVRHSQLPGLNILDLIVSGRNEHYSDFGAKTVPKIGLVYVPTSSIKLRSTWGKAFRAPNLNDAYGIQQLIIEDIPNPASSTGSSPVLARIGGNPSLQPETANEWSIGADYSPAELSGLQVSTTLFNIKYTNRIASITNLYASLTDPLNSFFVTSSPSASAVQSLYDGYPPSQIYNQSSDTPFDPRKIGAIVDDRMVNVASQTVRGADLSVDYKIGAGSNSGLLFFNGTYLNLVQQDTPQAAQKTLSGLAFYPPKFRLRGGATWKLNAWALTGAVNYLPRETDSQVTPFQTVSSWMTVDASLRYAPALPGILAGLHVSLSVLNAFDRNPPFVALSTFDSAFLPGLNYDSTNTSPMGRFLTLRVSKDW
jgi:iron complex outermembrane recepter protein